MPMKYYNEQCDEIVQIIMCLIPHDRRRYEAKYVFEKCREIADIMGVSYQERHMWEAIWRTDNYAKKVTPTT